MNKTITKKDLIKLDENLFEIPDTFREDMRVPARVFTSESLLNDILEDNSLWQLTNVATLPGIQKAAFAMPDIHQGYGFPIGGVAAMAIEEGGVISPGGIGYDINCGVRLMKASISHKEIEPHLEKLAQLLFEKVPSGVGRGGSLILDNKQLNTILEQGAPALLAMGLGMEKDIEFCESNGHLKEAQADAISSRAKQRGADQIGTLGSGNHFLEIQVVDEIYDHHAAAIYGLERGMITVMVHCGSRGLGHQVCSDYVRQFIPQLPTWGITLVDMELACAPFKSTAGQNYFAAMSGAANFAWANRHLIGQRIRESFLQIFGPTVALSTIYDVSHNMGKIESHSIDGMMKKMIVHRKGATRAFGPHHPEVSTAYQSIGQPVLIPGTMGTSSYVLAGTKEGMEIAFGSSCHGAGRRMSRIQAKKTIHGSKLREDLQKMGIIIASDSDTGLAEEAPAAYKNVEKVVKVVHESHLAHKVAKLLPLGVVKGG